MQSDDVIWQVINNGFCSYKVKTPSGGMFCKNENNVTGLCNKQSCPLANSKYATVREVGGKCYLFKKVIERSHLPSKMWEKIRLRGNEEQVMKKLQSELEFMSSFTKGKCGDRYVRIMEYARRREKLQNDPNELVYETKAMKVVRRERGREAKAKKVALLENAIEHELLERLQKGVYGDIYNLPQNQFNSALKKSGGKIDEMEEDDEEYEDEEDSGEYEFVEGDDSDEEEEEEEEEEDLEFIDDFQESDDDMEDFSNHEREIEYENDVERERELQIKH